MKRTGLSIVVLLAFACADTLDHSEDRGGLNEGVVQQKQTELEIVVLGLCTHPCRISVSGITDSLVAGVEYYVDGRSVGTSVNWWSDYDFELPSGLTGTVSLQANVLAPDSSTLQTAQAQTILGEDIDTAPGPELSSLSFVSGSRCENPCELRVEPSADIVEVEFYADEFFLGKGNAEGDFAISYGFSQTGIRRINVRAFNAQQERVRQITHQLEVVESVDQPAGTSTGSGALPNVPFFYQFNNRLSPSATCQNTSVAMVLAYLGWQGVPDDLTAAYGRRKAQSPAGLADLFNIYARSLGTSKRLTPVTNGSIATLRAELDRGEPIIIHGFFTGAGHVLVVLGYDADYYYVNDPAGTWSESFKGGYYGSAAGKQIRYRRAAFEAAVATSNGYSQLPLWYHILR